MTLCKKLAIVYLCQLISGLVKIIYIYSFGLKIIEYGSKYYQSTKLSTECSRIVNVTCYTSWCGVLTIAFLIWWVLCQLNTTWLSTAPSSRFKRGIVWPNRSHSVCRDISSPYLMCDIHPVCLNLLIREDLIRSANRSFYSVTSKLSRFGLSLPTLSNRASYVFSKLNLKV